MRLVLAITGASGACYALHLLRKLQELGGHEVWLIISHWGHQILEHECRLSVEELMPLVQHYYSPDDLAAPLASSSFPVDGMVILPASCKTCAAIAHGYSHSLITRAAENMLRLHKRLIIGIRETPLSIMALENLLQIARAGGTVLPLSPAYYNLPTSLDQLQGTIIAKILDLLTIEHDYPYWQGRGT